MKSGDTELVPGTLNRDIKLLYNVQQTQVAVVDAFLWLISTYTCYHRGYWRQSGGVFFSL